LNARPEANCRRAAHPSAREKAGADRLIRSWEILPKCRAIYVITTFTALSGNSLPKQRW
jgi:hypothetical protein